MENKINEVFGAGHVEVALSQVTNTPHQYDKNKSWYQNQEEMYGQTFEDAIRILINNYHYSNKKLKFVKKHFTIEGDDLVIHKSDNSGFLDRCNAPVSAQRLARKIDDTMTWRFGKYAQGDKFEESTMLVKMNDEEYENFKTFLKESANLSDMVDIPTLVADFEEYVAANKLHITSDEDLTNACNDFLTQNDMESLVGTEVVEDILNYVDDNYNA